MCIRNKYMLKHRCWDAYLMNISIHCVLYLKWLCARFTYIGIWIYKQKFTFSECQDQDRDWNRDRISIFTQYEYFFFKSLMKVSSCLVGFQKLCNFVFRTYTHVFSTFVVWRHFLVNYWIMIFFLIFQLCKFFARKV